MSKAKIFYHDIGDYLSREEKLNIVQKFGSMANMPWQELTPNEHGDWISMRNESFDTFIPMAPEKKFDLNSESLFIAVSNGILTAKDSWLINSSFSTLKENVSNMMNFYNEQRELYHKEKEKNPNLKIEQFVTYDSKKISWSDLFLKDAEKNLQYDFIKDVIHEINYRPFNKQNLYYDKKVIQRTYQNQRLFPIGNENNLVICISCVNSNKGLSVSLTDSLADYHFNGDTQCFPLYFYEENTSAQKGLFDEEGAGDYIRRDAVSDFILKRAQQQYGISAGSTAALTKEDIFYYVYGFLHSKSYRETFANDLKKMLPRLPLVEDVRDFWAFSKAGRQLSDLHLNYESVPAHPALEVTGDVSPFGGGLRGRTDNPTAEDFSYYRVEKMRFPTGLKAKDRPATIHYNSRITVNNIPPQAYDYIVNGKSAIEWIIERYAITTHKDSGITNDPNDWAEEVGNPRYVLDLLLSVVEVSVKSVEIVEGLVEMKFE